MPVGQNYLTMADLAGRLDPQRRLAVMADLISRVNPVLQDAPWVEGNLETANKGTIRTGLPKGTWRSLYQGVMPEKSSSATVIDACGLLESYSEVDAELLRLAPNAAQFRMDEESTFIEGLGITMEDTLFYGDTDVNPDRFMGLTPRYSDKSAQNGSNVIRFGTDTPGNAGQNGDRTSIWLVCWDPMIASMFYGKGNLSGLRSQDLGEDTKVNADGSMFQVVRSHFAWQAGFYIKDWRYVVRIANVRPSDPGGDPSAYSHPLQNAMIRAINMLPTTTRGRKMFYANEDIITQLDLERVAINNVNLTLGEWAGDATTMCRGIPVRKASALVNNEAVVS